MYKNRHKGGHKKIDKLIITVQEKQQKTKPEANYELSKASYTLQDYQGWTWPPFRLIVLHFILSNIMW